MGASKVQYHAKKTPHWKFILSDKSIRIFEVNNDKTTYLTSFTTHDGPVWQLSWAHPKFGPILASAGFDKKVKIALTSKDLKKIFLRSLFIKNKMMAPGGLSKFLKIFRLQLIPFNLLQQNLVLF